MKKLSIFWIGACLVGMLTSCQSGTDQGAGGATMVSVDDTSGIDYSAAVKGDWIRVYNPADPDALHPYNAKSGSAIYVKDLVFSYLYELDPHTMKFVPCLVTELAQVSEDGLSYTWEFRPEARWDDGSPILAEDYEFSLKAALEPLTEAQHIRGYHSFIQDVILYPDNPRKFTVVIDAPFFLAENALAGLEVISKAHYDPDGHLDELTVRDFYDRGDELKSDSRVIAFNDNFMSEKYHRDPAQIYGSNAYKVESWVTGSKVTLSRKEDWWGYQLKDKGYPFTANVDKIIFKTITDKNAAIMACKAGELDLMRDIPGPEFDELKEDPAFTDNFNFLTPDTYGYVYLAMNMRPPSDREPILEDKRVRKAMAHIADVDRIIENVYGGYGKRVIGPISPYNVNEYHTGLKPVEFAPDKAVALLEEAGWKDTNGDGTRDKILNGKRTEFKIKLMVSNSSGTAPSLARMVINEAKKIGCIIELDIVPFQQLSQRVQAHDFDMFGLGFNGSPLPKDLKQVWHTDSWVNRGSNYTGFGDETTDKLIEDIRVTTTIEGRKPLYMQFQEILHDQQPMIFIMAPQERILIHKRFENAIPTVVRPGYKIPEFYVPKDKQQFGN